MNDDETWLTSFREWEKWKIVN